MSDVNKTDQEWRETLSPEQYRICRGKGTEAPFTGKYYATKTPGIYRCACCGEALFESSAKYDSGSGWPSFFRAVSDGTINTAEDRSLGMIRTEITCSRCGSHLGHLFPDGPEPTGMRYCVNSASLELEPSED